MRGHEYTNAQTCPWLSQQGAVWPLAVPLAARKNLTRGVSAPRRGAARRRAARRPGKIPVPGVLALAGGGRHIRHRLSERRPGRAYIFRLIFAPRANTPPPVRASSPPPGTLWPPE